eukprot:5546922-Pleurochrysis_carterae.AAC.1
MGAHSIVLCACYFTETLKERNVLVLKDNIGMLPGAALPCPASAARALPCARPTLPIAAACGGARAPLPRPPIQLTLCSLLLAQASRLRAVGGSSRTRPSFCGSWGSAAPSLRSRRKRQ